MNLLEEYAFRSDRVPLTTSARPEAGGGAGRIRMRLPAHNPISSGYPCLNMSEQVSLFLYATNEGDPPDPEAKKKLQHNYHEFRDSFGRYERRADGEIRRK
jgi:hypothetical protein